jgi:antitoxin ParD1/3/4
MNVSLTPELQNLVEAKVRTGRYHSASEVIREGLRLLEEHDQVRELRLMEVRRKIRQGLDELDRGEGIPGEKVYQQMKRKSAAFRRRKS